MFHSTTSSPWSGSPEASLALPRKRLRGWAAGVSGGGGGAVRGRGAPGGDRRTVGTRVGRGRPRVRGPLRQPSFPPTRAAPLACLSHHIED